jgi:hypothetical protein
MAFVKRAITVRLKKTTNSATNLAGTTVDQLELNGLRVILQSYNRPQIFGTAQVQIYGMSPSDMAFFTKVQDANALLNSIELSVLAGQLDAQMSLVYTGVVIQSQAELNQAPNVVFNVTCQSAANFTDILIAPRSYSASVAAATVLADMANQAGLTFVNGGVTAVINTPYLSGSWTDQLRSIAMAAGANFLISNGELNVWPKAGAAPSAMLTKTTITPKTGLIGYPRREGFNMMFDCEYNPAVKPGHLIMLDGLDDFGGLVKNCLGTWQVLEILHNLTAEMPGGPWMSSVTCGLQQAAG